MKVSKIVLGHDESNKSAWNSVCDVDVKFALLLLDVVNHRNP